MLFNAMKKGIALYLMNRSFSIKRKRWFGVELYQLSQGLIRSKLILLTEKDVFAIKANTRIEATICSTCILKLLQMVRS